MNLKMLDCFCGLGGASSGFAKEGFDCTGIDIVNVGYPYRFILADMHDLKGEDFRGYDVIWGSPPCRDFCLFAKRFGKTWKKNPPDPAGKGLDLVYAFNRFVKEARPKIWVCENVPNLANYVGARPRFVANLRGERQMVRAFWGNFPSFILPRDNKNVVMRFRPECNEKQQVISRKEERAKIPLACSQAFARACKEELVK